MREIYCHGKQKIGERRTNENMFRMELEMEAKNRDNKLKVSKILTGISQDAQAVKFSLKK